MSRKGEGEGEGEGEGKSEGKSEKGERKGDGGGEKGTMSAKSKDKEHSASSHSYSQSQGGTYVCTCVLSYYFVILSFLNYIFVAFSPFCSYSLKPYSISSRITNKSKELWY